MKRSAAIVFALAFSIGLHIVLIFAGREPKPPLSPEAARVPDRLYSASIYFPPTRAAGADPVQDYVDSLDTAPVMTR